MIIEDSNHMYDSVLENLKHYRSVDSRPHPPCKLEPIPNGPTFNS